MQTELTEDTNFEIDAPMHVDDNMQTDADNDAPTDADNDAPTDADSDTPMDADDPPMEDDNDLYVGDRAHKSEDSDSQSSLTFRRPKNKRRAVGTKRRIQVVKDSSDEDDDIEVSDVDPRLTKPMGSVGTAKTAKQAVRMTSSVSSIFNNNNYLYYWTDFHWHLQVVRDSASACEEGQNQRCGEGQNRRRGQRHCTKISTRSIAWLLDRGAVQIPLNLPKR